MSWQCGSAHPGRHQHEFDIVGAGFARTIVLVLATSDHRRGDSIAHRNAIDTKCHGNVARHTPDDIESETTGLAVLPQAIIVSHSIEDCDLKFIKRSWRAASGRSIAMYILVIMVSCGNVARHAPTMIGGGHNSPLTVLHGRGWAMGLTSIVRISCRCSPLRYRRSSTSRRGSRNRVVSSY